MYKQKIGISVGNHYPIQTLDVVKMLKEIGFDAISPEWKEGAEFAELVEKAREYGLIVQSLHAPFGNAAAMWSSDEKICNPAKKELLTVLDDCKAWSIPIMVVHAWIGFDYEFDDSKLNFQNFDELIAKAKEYGITIAFENTEGEEYLFALMERYKTNHTAGFCWDSGHEMCYNYSQDYICFLTTESLTGMIILNV